MSERRRAAEGLDVERTLSEVGPRVAYPPTPDLAAAVAAAIGREAPAAVTTAPGSARVRRPRRWAFAGVALLVVAGCLASFPIVRSTVADRFGVDGVRIFFLDAEPNVPPRPVGGGLRLGRRVGLEEAKAAVPFAIHLPTRDGFDEPEEVYLSAIPDDEMVSLVYPSRADLPVTSETGVGALLTQFPGRTEEPLATKSVGPTASVVPVLVGDGQGFWIEGEAHLFTVRDPSGEIRYEEYRLAGNVLLWEQDGLTFRFESALTKDAALAIADTVRALR